MTDIMAGDRWVLLRVVDEDGETDEPEEPGDMDDEQEHDCDREYRHDCARCNGVSPFDAGAW